MTQLKKALGYARASSDPGDSRRGAFLTVIPQPHRNVNSLRCLQQSPNDLYHRRYQLSTSAGYLSGDMRPFEENVPATASAALGRFREERCSVYECHDRTLSPVWGTGSSYRRLSVNLDDNVSRLTASARSKTSLGHKSSLSKYTPLPAIGSGCSQEEREVAANADQPCKIDDGQNVSQEHENSDVEDCGHEEDVEGESNQEYTEPESEDGSSLEGEDGNTSADGSGENEEEEGDKSQADADECDEQQPQDSGSNGENVSENVRPPLVRSRTFTVLKVDESEGEDAGEGDRAVKKGGVAFFIGGVDDVESEKEKSEDEGCDDDDNQAD
ncbi:hypothetical protein MRX96_034140 [Rhipicephalus microplus]